MEKLKISTLCGELPQYLTRSQVARYLPGLGLSPSHLANLASKGEGPHYLKISGKTVIYETEKLLEWLDNRIESVEPSSKKHNNSIGNTDQPKPRRGRPRKADQIKQRGGGRDGHRDR